MGLGSTAKKLQQVVDAADELYAKINDLKSDLAAMRDTIEETNSSVGRLESELDTQRELLEAIAETEGVTIEDPEADEESTKPKGSSSEAS